MNSAWITTVAAISAAAMLNWKNTQVTHFVARPFVVLYGNFA